MNNPLSVAPDTETTEWECPYCEQTRQSLQDIRNHITESAEGDHRGIDGLKPTRDIIAYGADGSEAERIEGVSTEAADSLDSYSKQELIINSWLAADRDPDRDAIEAISGASQQYVSRLLNELESGEIPRETYIEVLDYGLKDELEERLGEYDPEDRTAGFSIMSAQTTATAEDVVENSTKKDRIIAAYRLNPNAPKKEVADALDVSYEYVRQIFKDIEERDSSEWQKLRKGDLEEDPAEELMDAVEQRLQEDGALADASEEGENRESVSREWASSGQVKGMVAAKEIADVRDKVELLLEQAEYTGHGNAEFVSKKTLKWLDDLLEEAK